MRSGTGLSWLPCPVSGHIGQFFLSTVIVITGGVFFTMLLGSMAAYVLARYRFPGNRVVYYFFVAGLGILRRALYR